MNINDGGGGVLWNSPGPTPNAPPPSGGVSTGDSAPPAPPASNLKSLIPGSASYLQAKSVADAALSRAQQQISFQRNTSASRYGYLLNPDGTVKGVDPNNPYGAYQQERSSEAAATLQGMQAQRAGGWGRTGMIAGALQRAQQGINKGMYNQTNQWQDSLQGFIDAGVNAQGTHDQTLNDAWQSAWQNAIGSGQYDPVSGAPIAPAGAGPGGPAPYSPAELGGRVAVKAPATKANILRPTVKPKAIKPGRRP